MLFAQTFETCPDLQLIRSASHRERNRLSEHFRCGTGCDCDCDYDYDYDLAGNGETCAAPTLTLHSTVVGGNVLHSRQAGRQADSAASEQSVIILQVASMHPKLLS
ncbi:hypothetical protein AXG93_3235s1140 [Marchantia polymorpha subsp. ruderalis]|uniref:Uncharacterized protein n=1 Tax=Marchantia polymorpha subsp. ruderalis TaxID=1480154 RepID=A0A176WNX2_MARPO|nr:hypothetical protein AXG93_3235s1140 [Marchantia polymorpha subsp. ruderalis]